MRKRLNFLLIIFILGLAFSANAALSIDNPCPDVKNILAVKLTPESRGENAWSFWTINKFGTEFEWLFGITFFDTKTEKEAINKIKNALPTLRRNGYDKQIMGKAWICGYDIDINGSALMMQKIN